MNKILTRNEEGFLDLDKYFDYLDPSTLSKEKRITEYIYSRFAFYYEDTLYFYKPSRDYYWFELIAYHIAKLLGIKAAFYDLVSFNGSKGVISKDIRDKDLFYIPFREIMDNYCFYNNINSFIKVENLVSIQKALECFFFDEKQQTTRHNLVNSVMDDIIDMFIFDEFIGNDDRDFCNYVLAEDKNHTTAHLAPLFDQEGAFRLDTTIKVRENDFRDYADFESVMRDFTTLADDKYLSRLKELFSKYTPQLIHQAFVNAESQIKAKIPYYVKKHIYIWYNEQYKMIEKILVEKENSSGTKIYNYQLDK